MSFYSYQALKCIGISEPQIARLLPKVTSQVLKCGELVEPNGLNSGDWIHVVNGLIGMITNESRSKGPITFYGPGSWIFTGQITNFSLISKSFTSARIMRIPASEAHQLLDEELGVANFIAKAAMWRENFNIQRLFFRRQTEPAGRVLLELAQLGQWLNCSASHLPTLLPELALPIPLKRLELTAYLNISRSLLSDCISEISEKGWLRSGYGQIELLKPKVWAALLTEEITSAKDLDSAAIHRATLTQLLENMSALQEKLYAPV